MTQQETDALNVQRTNLDAMQRMGGAYGSAIQSISGLFNPDGTINQTALQNFGQQVQGYQNTQQGVYDTALQQGMLEDQLYRQALAGTGPVSEGLKQQKAKDFQMLKESAGRRGIRITGDSFENATSNSTAGIRMLGEMGRRYDLAVDNERNALRQWGSGQSLNRMGALASFDPTASRMGYLNQATVGMMPILNNINQGYMGYMQPYQQQRMAQFNRDSAQAQADAQWKNSMWQGAGQLAGMGVSMALAPMTGGMSLMAMPGIMGGMNGGRSTGYAPQAGQFQGSYNQYATMNGMDPNQYAPMSVRYPRVMGGM
jgi:hypothetical protein